MQPNPADGEPATLKIYPPLPTSGSFSDNQHGGSLPRRCERSILIGIVGLQARQSNRPRAAQPVAPGFRVTPWSRWFRLCASGDQDLLDHYRVFNAGDDFHGAAAAAAGLDVDIENTLEPLRPCHRRSPLCWCCRFISHPDLVAPAPFCRRDQRPVPTVGCEHPVEAG